MLGGLLLRLLLAMALCPGLRTAGSGGQAPALAKRLLLPAALGQNLHLCEGYAGPDGRLHPGFYCPRLSDPPGHRFCCRPGPHALKSCCSHQALEALTGVNLSSMAAPDLLRNPLALPFVGLYGLLILLLMAVDLLHFYRTHRCCSCLGRLLPCRPCRPPGGCQQPRSHPPHSSRDPEELSTTPSSGC